MENFSGGYSPKPIDKFMNLRLTSAARRNTIKLAGVILSKMEAEAKELLLKQFRNVYIQFFAFKKSNNVLFFFFQTVFDNFKNSKNCTLNEHFIKTLNIQLKATDANP